MAKEAQIVAQINTDLIANQFGSKKFQKGRFSGIAELVTKVDGETRQTIPMFYDNAGNETHLSLNDKYPFELYHRHTGSTVEPLDSDQQFGSRVLRKVSAQMIMVIIGDRTKLKVTKEEIITGIMLGMPLELGSSFLTTNSLDNVNIIPGDWNLNKEDAWLAEYATELVEVKPEMLFMTMTYVIETQAKVGCIDLCA